MRGDHIHRFEVINNQTKRQRMCFCALKVNSKDGLDFMLTLTQRLQTGIAAREIISTETLIQYDINAA